MFKVLKNQDGFSGLIGIIMAVVVIGIMSAMMLPTFTAKMNYKQAQYVVGVTKTIENAENSYMAKNGSFLDLTDLGSDGYLSPTFLSAISESSTSYTYTPSGSTTSTTYYTSTWTGIINKTTVNGCITNYPSSIFSAAGTGCPNNPGTGNGYYLTITNIPVQNSSVNYANYIVHELPGSGIGSMGGSFDYVAYSAPVPSAPPANTSGAVPAAKYTQSWLTTGEYTWTVPNGVTVISVSLAGGNGIGYPPGSYSDSKIGYGGELLNKAMNVIPGETLNIYVANGSSAANGDAFGYANGGAGSAGTSYANNGYSGGGSSAVVGNGQIIMAPGGGGYAGNSNVGVGGGGGGYYNGNNGIIGDNSSGSGGYGGGGNGGNGITGGTGGTGGSFDYNSAGAPSGIIPGPGYPFVQIQWN
jgi:type II secretory pathway pseudopilin PulG